MCLSSSDLINSESAWDQSVSTSPVVRSKKGRKRRRSYPPIPSHLFTPNCIFEIAWMVLLIHRNWASKHTVRSYECIHDWCKCWFFFSLEKNNNKTTSLFVWLQVSGLTLFQRFICRNSCLNECSCVSGRWWGEAIGILFSACSCQINTSLENNMGLWCASQSALGLLKKK